ncbi:type III PLP-dependent enzyme domain-containing protein [Actinomadura algeriensis]|uniref:Uncharacterized protein n=1 Tax=Actinomadura algeriensis TaxID=1679523 RepID=A0ABR9JI27_9ACTN|nr:hypothetical protein [Actinomadura algeriensis]MBE1530188.1 hypothetical protein [Actinomadura algeriensis]
MAVDYSTPDTTFDWKQYGTDVAELAQPGEALRIEPGRSISVYSGWYLTEVLDVKKAGGQWYAVLRGGTMHIRTRPPPWRSKRSLYILQSPILLFFARTARSVRRAPFSRVYHIQGNSSLDPFTFWPLHPKLENVGTILLNIHDEFDWNIKRTRKVRKTPTAQLHLS